MATARPPAVVISACPMPWEMTAGPPNPSLAIELNVSMMPSTVPNRPRNGAVPATHAKKRQVTLQTPLNTV